ncbi:Dehydrogenase [Lachnellula suecica]|uniref:Short-chain dehydrogenase/reductase 3 n=1 Tax=Lachnellula suecica TaxID=602035 RepID=A0A8T9C9K7_9HELO|nr:Dehydrogenase [Lachnellula suecica]
MPTAKVSAFHVLSAPIRLSLFEPKVTGPLLFALLYYPEKVLSLLPDQLHQYVTSKTLIRTLKFALAWGVVRALNSKLSDMAANNFKGKANFVKSQEIVLISGGASGIGALMAKDFAAKGVKVIALDLNPPKEPFPSNIYFYQADVTSSAQIAKAAAEIRKDHGEPTVLINNAGVGFARTILTEPEEMIRKTFEVNIIAHFLMVKEFLPAMVKKDHGHVVTIASMSSFVAPAQIVDYGATKVAAVCFHEGLASELKNRYNAPNVKTTIVHPGWIRTPLIEALTTHPDFHDEVLEPPEVTNAIINQVLSGKSAQLILPKKLTPLAGLRGWPMWMQLVVRNGQGKTLQVVEGL